MNHEDATGEETASAIVPVREAQVEFYGDTLSAALGTDEEIYVPLRPICEALGLTWPGQWERIKGDPVLGDAVRSVRVTRK